MQNPAPNKFGFLVARRLIEAPENEWPAVIELLRSSRKLSVAVHEMNALLQDPERKGVALAALRRIGLEYSG